MLTRAIKNNFWYLTLLFLGAFLLRALFFIHFTRHGQNAYIYVDSQQYLDVAHNLRAGKGFCLNDGLKAYRLPGYPAFLAMFALTPRQSSGLSMSGSWKLALWIQIILASVLPLLIFFLSLTLLPGNFLVAWIAAGASALHPGFVLYAGMIATESLCVLFLLLFFIVFFNQRFWLAGMFLGLASLFRPLGHYVLLIALCMIVVLSYAWKKKVAFVFRLSAGWLAIVAPWLIRNFLLFGHLFFHSLPGLHFLQYSAAHVVAQAESCQYPVARAKLLNEWKEEVGKQEQRQGRQLNEYEQCREAEKLTATIVKQHPWLMLKYSCSELFKTGAGLYSAIILLADGAAWPDYGSKVTWMTKIKRFLKPDVKRWFLVPFIYLDILFLLLMILGFGLFLLQALQDVYVRSVLMSMLPLVVLLMGLTVAYGGARLRMPAEPLLLIGAVYGWVNAGKKYAKHH
jgi:hypothetical protein